MDIQWKDIKGYEDRYAVSNDGRVMSKARELAWGPGKKMVAAREMRLQKDTKGYLYVSLYGSGELSGRRNYRVHQLVARAFLGDPGVGQEVCHEDGVRTNNQVENLRWDTRSANILDAVGHGTHSRAAQARCKRGHLLGGPNSDGKDRECLACRRGAATVAYHIDLRPHRQEVCDRHYANLIGERRRMLRSDFDDLVR